MDKEFEPVRNAAYAGDFELFKTLLGKTPDLVTRRSSDSGDSPNLIQFVVVEGGLGKIPEPAKYLRHLIENGATTERQLVAAASVNAKELVDALLESGVSLDDGAPWTAVEESLYWGHWEMGRYLLDDRGAELDSLCAAAMVGDMQKLNSFFDDGKLIASVLPVYFPWGPFHESSATDALEQAFILAIRHRQYEVASYLLERGVDINAITCCYHEECTALHLAARLNDFESVDWLIDRGADTSIKDRRFDADAAAWALKQGHTEIAERLNTE